MRGPCTRRGQEGTSRCPRPRTQGPERGPGDNAADNPHGQGGLSRVVSTASRPRGGSRGIARGSVPRQPIPCAHRYDFLQVVEGPGHREQHYDPANGWWQSLFHLAISIRLSGDERPGGSITDDASGIGSDVCGSSSREIVVRAAMHTQPDRDARLGSRGIGCR